MDIFECAICLEQFNDPRVITCGHTFCKSCLQKLKPNQLLCPLCLRSFESVDRLPSNFVVLKWMDENKNQNIEKKKIKCDNCEDKLAVVWCEKCENYYCDDCDSTAHFIKTLRSHLRISLKEKSKKPTFTKCRSHTRDNEVYCIDCKSLICTICVIDYHKQHQVKSVSKCAEEKRVELKSCVAPFQNLKPLMKLDQEFKLAKEKDVAELESIEIRAQVLKNQILQHDRNIQQISTRTDKVKTSEIVLMNSIQEMGDMDLLDNKNVEMMKKKIQDVLQEVYPEGDKERLEMERWEFFSYGTIETNKFTATYPGAWVTSVLLSGNLEITLEIDTTQSNGWFQVGIGSLVEFPHPGENSPPNLSFCYHGYRGTVNNTGSFEKFYERKCLISIKLTIESNTIRFSVNNSEQNGTWKVPTQFRVLIDVYNPHTSVKLMQCKRI